MLMRFVSRVLDWLRGPRAEEIRLRDAYEEVLAQKENLHADLKFERTLLEKWIVKVNRERSYSERLIDDLEAERLVREQLDAKVRFLEGQLRTEDRHTVESLRTKVARQRRELRRFNRRVIKKG